MATCLYKPKPCDVCGKVIPVGAECQYIEATKGVRHYGCEPPDPVPTPADFSKASELGFVPSGAVDGVLWSRMRFLPPADREHAERGAGEARGEQSTLWSMPAGTNGEE